MITNIILGSLLACWDKSQEKNTETSTEPTSEPSTTEASTEPASEDSMEPAGEPSTENLEFDCADETCTEGQYCYQFYPGVFDSGGPPNPYCEIMPTECANDYSCDCLVNLGICLDCAIENGGIYCTMAGAK